MIDLDVMTQLDTSYSANGMGPRKVSRAATPQARGAPPPRDLEVAGANPKVAVRRE